MSDQNVDEYYERIFEKSSIDYEYETRCLELVKKFVIERKLIVFGGYAIDKALKLKGTKIYRDDEKPDIDVLSPNSVRDAYDLVEILRAEGYQNVAAIRGIHITTMRVRTNFIYVIDIAYIPPKIYELIPTINFNNIHIVHPLYQRMDMHLSFSFPFFGCPRENIFNRWEKDLKRFNLIEKYYPIVVKDTSYKKHTIKVKNNRENFALCGFPAYAALYSYLCMLCDFLKDKSFNTRISAIDKIKISATKTHIECESLDEYFTIISPDCKPEYNQYLDIIPKYQIDENYQIFDSSTQLISISCIDISAIEFNVVSIQYVLLHMLINYFKSKNDVYLLYYKNLLEMIDIAEELYKKHNIYDTEFKNSPFSLLTSVLGNVNIDKSYIVKMNKNIRSTRDFEKYPKILGPEVVEILKNVPSEYYDNRPNDFDYESSIYFNKIGQKL